MRGKVRVVAVLGPTAAGKTALALALAEALEGEIVSADSRQVYVGMDIGTAKATWAERQRVPHHLLDVVNPDQLLTLAEYQAMAYQAIAGIAARGRLPLLVGGTGQYVSAVLEGWRIPAVAPQPALRAALEAEAATAGPGLLHDRLAGLDPAAAARIDARNVRRVIRALEVCLTTGRPLSDLQAKGPPPYTALKLGVTRSRPELYRRIDTRVDDMVSRGLVEEVRSLSAAGYSWFLPSMTGLGYRQIGAYLRGEASLDQALDAAKQATRRLVQQQYNWFRISDPAIHWFDPGETPVDGIVARVRAFLE